ESVEGGERLARFSFIGTEPSEVIKTGPKQAQGPVDPLKLVEESLNRFKLVPVEGLPRFHGGMVGYLSYDAVSYFEPRVQSPEKDSLGLPEAIFMLTETMLIFDHLRQKIQIVSHVYLENDIEQAYTEAIRKIEQVIQKLEKPLPTQTKSRASTPETIVDIPYKSNFSQETYHELVKRAKEFIVAGDIIQVVLSQRLERPTMMDPLDIYRALRRINPSPYLYYLELGDFHIVGASPELLVRVEDNVVLNMPLAGTRPRGKTPEEDVTLAEELRLDEKEIAEHIMLVDLGRNDVGRVSEPGSVTVNDLMRIVQYSHVMHLESEVQGFLKSDRTMYDALRSCLPAGTLSGAPKIRAMEIISDLEKERRGPYGGAVGYLSFAGNMDTAITIRTMVIKDGVAYIQAGGGIVYDSVPENEYKETLHKAQALMKAIEEAESGQL
ncbi:anthranilate synthase component I, partial [SAR202 cluster bacterium AD-802-E10_MRT_200m]|nr:anthranilate synthase component I [SAR202 cluster bacterium AD-802-E10_MRT_200m]